MARACATVFLLATALIAAAVPAWSLRDMYEDEDRRYDGRNWLTQYGDESSRHDGHRFGTQGQYQDCRNRGKCCKRTNDKGERLYCFFQNNDYSQCNTAQECSRSKGYDCSKSQGSCGRPLKRNGDEEEEEEEDVFDEEEEESIEEEEEEESIDEEEEEESNEEEEENNEEAGEEEEEEEQSTKHHKGSQNQYQPCRNGGKCCKEKNNKGQKLYCFFQNKDYSQCNTKEECKKANGYDCNLNQGSCGKPLKNKSADEEDEEEEEEANEVSHKSGDGADCKKDFCCSGHFKCYMWSGKGAQPKYECRTKAGCEANKRGSPGWQCESPKQCKKRHGHGNESNRNSGSGEGQYQPCRNNGKCCKKYNDNGEKLYCLYQNNFYSQCNTLKECSRANGYDCNPNQGSCGRPRRHKSSDEEVEEEEEEGDEMSNKSGDGADCKKDFCCSGHFKCYMWSGKGAQPKYECRTKAGCEANKRGSRGWQCDSPKQCKKRHGHRNERTWNSGQGQYQPCRNDGKCCKKYNDRGEKLYCFYQNPWYSQCNTAQECARSNGYDCSKSQGSCGRL